MDGLNTDVNGSEFTDTIQSLAQKFWVPEGKKKVKKFNPKVVDQIFAGLSERSFPLRDLITLDQSLYLEK